MFSSILRISATVLILVAAYLASGNISDWLQLRNYIPPPFVSDVTTATSMTKYAQNIFYLTAPEIIVDGKTLNSTCNEETANILGCYIPQGNKIFIHQVSDDRIKDAMKVAAAHEMLHAAYHRLRSREKNIVNAGLEEYFNSSSNEVLKARIAAYKKSNADTSNELHSILGTEIANLPIELEEYYARYFKNRNEVVSFYLKYEVEFEKRKAQVSDFDRQLELLKSQISALDSSLAQNSKQLQQEQEALKILSTANPEKFASESARFNIKAASYNVAVKQMSSWVKTYNDLVTKRNSIALESKELLKALSSQN